MPVPYSTDAAEGDLEKLRKAFSEIAVKFGSFDNVVEAFGLSSMPVAQRYGILFGCIVFVLTVTSVVMLLVFGGSFKRLAEQAETGEPTLLASHDARSKRPLLLETLLEGKDRMAKNYPDRDRQRISDGQVTNLTKMLLNVAPGSNIDDYFSAGNDDVVESKKEEEDGNRGQHYIPPHYQENYQNAYRKCQDRPGGSPLSGRPEARFEAYARAYAGCGPYTSLSYRRSYGRIYESIACASHATDDKYSELYRTRPHDLVGRYVRLEPLQVHRHLKDMFRLTNGEPTLDHKSYNPQEVWSFHEDGPFENETQMKSSSVFQRKVDEAAFGIVNALTDKLVGAIYLTKDDPTNLTIQLEPPIVPPNSEGKQEQFESCFLLMDRLFAYGYRRIQVSIDSQDANKRKLATRLGFTHEGVLCRHMIVKESSRDSSVYSMLNSDWKSGARASLFRKLYGVSAQRSDASNEKKEEEYDEQQRVLAEKKLLEEEAAAADGKKFK